MEKEKFPREMKRLSKPFRLTKSNINLIPEDAHGIYVIRNKKGAVVYVGIA